MLIHNNIDIVSCWEDKWREFAGLVMEEMFSDKETIWSLKLRSDIDEINYLRLRFWFIDHEDQFIPIWSKFVQYGGIDTFGFIVNEDEEDEEMISQIKSCDNPFKCFYDSPNIYTFALYLGAMISTPNNEPAHENAHWRLCIVSLLGRATLFCQHWLDICDYWLCGK